MVVTDLIQLTQPQVLRLAVDDLYRGVTAEKLGRYALILLGVALAAGLFRYWMRLTVIGISRNVEYDLRNALFAHLQKLPAEYFQRERAGDILSRATNDLASVRMMLGPGLMHFTNTVVMTIVAVGFMLAISPRLTLYTLLPLPLVSLTVWWFGERIHRRFEGIQAHFASISARVQESLAGVRVVRAFNRERAEVEEFDRLNREFLDRNLGLIRTSGALHPALAFLSGVASLTLLYLGGRDVVKDRITLGQFVAFTVYLGMLNWPMMALGWVISLFQRGIASWGRLLEVLDVEPAIVSAPNAWAPAPGVNGAGATIEFRNLTFSYPGAHRPALRDVSFQVGAGQTVAIVGRTGSGKSTLLSLLPRVFDPPPGTVFVDGVDVRAWDLDALRSHLAYAPQETFLFSTSVAGNIGYSVDDPDRAAVEGVARLAQLDSEARGFPSGYDTLVGERGIALSGGQKQRVAIARALLRSSPVLLLDDSLSSVDTHTEEAILHGLAGEMARRTTLIVSHRVSTVRDADFIVVLDDGAVLEMGRHDELLARDGAYADLHRRQQLEEELEAS